MTEEGHTVCLPRVPGRLTLDEASILDVVISEPTMAQPSAPSSEPATRPSKIVPNKPQPSIPAYDVGNDRKVLLEATLSDVIAHLLGVRSPPSRLPTRSMITGRATGAWAMDVPSSDAPYRSLIDDDQFRVSRQTFAANAIRIPCSLTRVFSR
jgi:hypothetical protein